MAIRPVAVALLGAALALTGTAVLASAAPVKQQPDRGPWSAAGTVTDQAGPRSAGAVPTGGSWTESASDTPGTPGATADFGWPVRGVPRVLRRFAPGPHRWSAGHRGVDVAGSGLQVLAAGPGTVTYAGVIAGRGVLVIKHGGGLRTTYEPVTAQVRVGQSVARGQPIGTLPRSGGHCPDAICLHWGALRDDRYLDPLELLPGARRAPVLLPLGTLGRSPPPRPTRSPAPSQEPA